MGGSQFDVPRLRSIARQATPRILEGIVAPVGIFYLAMWTVGIWGAVFVALAWSWGTIIVRAGLKRPVSGMLLLGAVGLTARSLVATASGSVFVYFLQPALGTVVVAAAFLGSVLMGKPLASRLARDVLPMPEPFWSHPEVRRYFERVTIVFGLVQLAVAGLSAWLLVSQPVELFLISKTAATAIVMGIAIGWSTIEFNRLLRSGNLAVPALVASTP